MARKRMLSPSIWESESFSALSDFAKLVFIGLISLSDDEGRGRANPSYIKSTLFPYDEHRRVAEVKSALSEIARCTSTQLYSVNGNDYYVLTSWTRWQRIDKPSKSKLPAPPANGEGEAISKNSENEKFVECSASIVRTLDEGSTIKKEVEREREIKVNRSSRRFLSESEYAELCSFIGKADVDYYVERIKAFKERKPQAVFDVKATILKWKREDERRPQRTEKTYTTEELNAYFDRLTEDDL